jgi:hypothetical protein
MVTKFGTPLDPHLFGRMWHLSCRQLAPQFADQAMRDWAALLIAKVLVSLGAEAWSLVFCCHLGCHVHLESVSAAHPAIRSQAAK